MMGLAPLYSARRSVKILGFSTRAQGTQAALYINCRDSMHSTSRQVLIVLGISLAKRVNCHMTTRVLNVILTDGTMPYYTTHAIAANSCALHVFKHPRQDYEQLRSSNRNPACAYSGYRHECMLLANKLSELKYSWSR